MNDVSEVTIVVILPVVISSLDLPDKRLRSQLRPKVLQQIALAVICERSGR